MKIVDLTHIIDAQTPVYPGTPKVKVENFATIEQDGFREKSLQLASHVGTHMDAPAHMLATGNCLDEFPVQQFMGSALVLNVTEYRGKELRPDLVQNIGNAEFILFYTGWNQKWGSASYFEDFPFPGIALAQALVQKGIKGIGLDTVSADSVENSAYPTHHELLKNEVLIIENLTNLELLPSTEFQFMALPLKIGEADGAPVRAIAILDERTN